MPRHVDALTSAKLKHLRERWWDSDFSDFLRDTLRPKPGTRILDVGCGAGTAEVSLGRLQIPQLELFAVDRRFDRAQQTHAAGISHNIRLRVATADAQELPYGNDMFDSTFCVGVLQHTPDVARAASELARVTKPGGRVVAVEPDNQARYWFSSTPAGQAAYETGNRFFAALATLQRDTTDPSVGPKLPAILANAGLEPLWINLFPVSVTRMGPPPKSVWDLRRQSLAELVHGVTDASVRTLAAEYQAALDAYEKEASGAGPGFVEIQNTMLFATVGQKGE